MLAAPIGTIAYDAWRLRTFLTDGEAVQALAGSGGDPAWDPSGDRSCSPSTGRGVTEYYSRSSLGDSLQKSRRGTTVSGDVQPSWGQKSPYSGSMAFLHQALPGIETQGVGATATGPDPADQRSERPQPRLLADLDSTIAFLRTTDGTT